MAAPSTQSQPWSFSTPPVYQSTTPANQLSQNQFTQLVTSFSFSTTSSVFVPTVPPTQVPRRSGMFPGLVNPPILQNPPFTTLNANATAFVPIRVPGFSFGLNSPSSNVTSFVQGVAPSTLIPFSFNSSVTPGFVNTPQSSGFSFGFPKNCPETPRVDLEEVNTTTDTPVPPNWDRSYDAALRASTIYIKINVEPLTNEYKVLAELVHSSPNLEVTGIQRVINCPLWKKFIIAREELLSLKSSDVKLLIELGLSASEAQQQADEFSSFKSIKGIPSFSDNMALLFHCTRKSVDSILKQGLDERLAKEGLLGNGIYFTDNPVKAVQYDQNNVLIVCAVLLGDCTQQLGCQSLVREPEKADTQKRSKNDQLFNSIVGRPNTGTSDNEFVIYDRRQCIPLYLIYYNKTIKQASQSTVARMYAEARNKFPPFAWISPPPFSFTHILVPSEAKQWPYFAQTIFNRMVVPNEEETNKEPNSVDNLFAKLRDMGFPDDKLNAEKLSEANNDLHNAIELLLKGTPTPATVQATTTIPIPECPICCEDVSGTLVDWSSFSCSHKVCSDCFKKLQKNGTTMSGQAHTFVKCPLCNLVDGIEIGTCPDGVMSPVVSITKLPGHDGYESIEISYVVKSGNFHTDRNAFLPDSPTGRRALSLLKIAWDRRLVFSVGTSMTTGQSNVLVWNIHHKTGIVGGVQAHAYPDSTYLDRLFDELKQYGIQ